MTASTQSLFEFAAKRLRWCLEQPLVCGGHAWGARVVRALEQLSEAYEKRVRLLESPGGPLEQIAEPGLLPFTAHAMRVSEFRGYCQRLRDRIMAITVQFRNAVSLFPADEAGPTDALADARAFRLFGVLRSFAMDLAEALDAYRTAEARILGEAEHASLFGK
jgi:hypothetical protein